MWREDGLEGRERNYGKGSEGGFEDTKERGNRSSDAERGGECVGLGWGVQEGSRTCRIGVKG